MDISSQGYMKGAVEALLFISERPVTIEQIKEALGTAGAAEIKNIIQEMMDEYEQNRRGIVIIEIAGGYQMLSSPHYVSYVKNFFKVRVKEKLSRPALETLAIMAYKQPVSRGDVEMIRGVNSDGVVTHLLNKSLVKIVGRKDVPGRPYIYGTTKLFLEYFGLKSLEDLPKLEEFSMDISMAEAPSEAEPSQPLADEIPQGETRIGGWHEASFENQPAEGGTEEKSLGEDSLPEIPGDEEKPAADGQQPAEPVEIRETDQQPALQDDGGQGAVTRLKEVMDEINRDHQAGETAPKEDTTGQEG